MAANGWIRSIKSNTNIKKEFKQTHTYIHITTASDNES